MTNETPNKRVLIPNANISVKRIRQPLRDIIFERSKGRCYYCGVELLNFKRKKGDVRPPKHPRSYTIEHIIPVSKGGKTNLTNLVACCFECNSRRGNSMSDAWSKTHE